jgi:hypothetical protein
VTLSGSGQVRPSTSPEVRLVWWPDPVLSGPIAQALGANASKLLARAPSIERIDVLRAKLPG